MLCYFLSVTVALNIIGLIIGGPDACTTCQCVPDSVYGGTLVICSNLNLKKIPVCFPVDTTSVLLNGNDITRTSGRLLPRLKSLRKLDLSFNQLAFLHEHTFASLGHLKELDLSSNRLPLDEEIYRTNLFFPLKKLISLKINNNSNSYYLPPSSTYPDKSFQRLKSLQVLHLDGLPADFGPGFRSLVHLSNLSLSDSDGFCVLPILRNSTFRNVPHLKHLNVSNCLIADTEHDTFTSLPNISVLDVSLNRNLGFDHFSKSTFGLRTSPLKLLKMNRLYPVFCSCSRLMIKHIAHLQHTPLIEIHFEGNGVIELEQNVLTTLPKSLESMYAGSNRFDYGIYIFQLFEMKSLRNLYLSKIYGWHETGPRFPFPVRFPANIEKVNVSSSYFRGSLYTKNSQNMSLKAFIASNNLLETIEGSFESYNKLEYLDLSYNIIKWFNRGPSVPFLPLKYLNLSHNYLGNAIEQDIHGRAFSNLFNLEYLDINSNGVEYLPEKAFKDLLSLKSLSLSDNKISTFNYSLRHMKQLQYLDLSYNTFENLGNNVLMDLDHLNNVTVNFAQNMFSCTCINMQFFKWLLAYRSKIQGLESSRCKLNNGTLMKLTELDNVISILSFQCVSNLAYFRTALSLFVVTVIAIFIIIGYRFRWRLRYMYYIGKKAKLQDDEEIEYKFDGFVSYADGDRSFVKEQMIREMEEKSGLRLCIHHRDFIPGAVIASNITNAIRNSRKTLIILSEDFLKSDWCDYEFNMARTEGVSRRKNAIVVVMYRRVSQQRMTHDMAYFLARYSYIEFDPTGDTDLFWSSLVDAIQTDEPNE